MAFANTCRKVGQGLSGLFLSLTGGWLLVIGVGGILTLGVLSVFQIGVLCSLGGMGLCLCIAGAAWLTASCTAAKSPVYDAPSEEAERRLWPLEANLTPHQRHALHTDATRFDRNPRQTDLPASNPGSLDKNSYHPFH